MAFTDNLKNFATFDGASQTLDGQHKICRVAWETGGTGGSVLTLTDADGSDLGTLTSEAAHEYLNIAHLQGMWVTDFTVDTIGGGTVYVQYE